MNAISAPLAFGMSEKPTTTRLAPLLRAEAEDEARRGWNNSLSSLVAWCVAQILWLSFLDKDNREFIEEQLRAIGRPFTEQWVRGRLAVLNQNISRLRELVREGRVGLRFAPKQQLSLQFREED